MTDAEYLIEHGWHIDQRTELWQAPWAIVGDALLPTGMAAAAERAYEGLLIDCALGSGYVPL
jgi:hypothetical protein